MTILRQFQYDEYDDDENDDDGDDWFSVESEWRGQ